MEASFMADIEVIAGIPVYNPVGETHAEARRVIPLPGEWRGKTVGFLDNSKANFDRLIGKLGPLLREQYGVAEVLYRRKPSSAAGAAPEMLAEMARQCDMVITGSGD
jgi:hypothetical protein